MQTNKFRIIQDVYKVKTFGTTQLLAGREKRIYPGSLQVAALNIRHQTLK